MNLIRFGPEDPQIFETQILPNISTIPMTRLLELCRCASLASKMDLFFQLLPHVMSIIECSPNNLNALYSNGVQEDRLELHKFIFDVHANCELLRPAIYEKSNFIGVYPNFYRVTFIKLNDETSSSSNSKLMSMLILLFSLKPFCSITYSIPRTSWSIFLKKWFFDNAQIFENFLVDLFSLTLNDSIFRINAENLSLIMKSESIRLIIYQFMDNSLIPRQPFIVSLATMMNLDDLASFPLFDIAHQPVRITSSVIYPNSEPTRNSIISILTRRISFTIVKWSLFQLFPCTSRFWLSHQNRSALPRNLSERS